MTGKTITPEYVERLIDETGHDLVFDRARLLGWGNDTTPPLWVWNQICIELRHEQSQASHSG